MKLDFDIVRELLIEIENNTELNSFISIPVDDYPENKLYALIKLDEAKLINSKILYASNKLYSITVSSLTWNGHNFLNNIREPNIWNKTKGIASKIGAKSFDAFIQISSNVISQIIINELNK